MSEQLRGNDRFPEVPAEHRAAFASVHDLLAWECRNLQFFHLMFGSEYAVKLLSASANECFGAIQASMLDDTILGVLRLIQQQDSKPEYRVLTIEALKPLALLMGQDAHSLFKRELKYARHLAESLKDHRNRRIAHMNELWGLNPTLIPPIDDRAVGRVLSILKDMMNAFHMHFRSARTYEMFEGPGGARDLLAQLDDARNVRGAAARAGLTVHALIERFEAS